MSQLFCAWSLSHKFVNFVRCVEHVRSVLQRSFYKDHLCGVRTITALRGKSSAAGLPVVNHFQRLFEVFCPCLRKEALWLQRLPHRVVPGVRLFLKVNSSQSSQRTLSWRIWRRSLLNSSPSAPRCTWLLEAVPAKALGWTFFRVCSCREVLRFSRGFSKLAGVESNPLPSVTSQVCSAAALMARVGSNPCHLVFFLRERRGGAHRVSGASQLQNVESPSFFLPRLWFYPVSLKVWET